MSRRDLLKACESIHIRTDNVVRGKRVGKDDIWLRMSIVERTAGPGFNWHFKSDAKGDAICVRLAATYNGKLGALLRDAQTALRNAMTEIKELRRLQTLKRRKWKDEAALRTSIRQWLEASEVACNLHEVESEMRANGYDLRPVEADARALANERYARYIEQTKSRIPRIPMLENRHST